MRRVRSWRTQALLGTLGLTALIAITAGVDPLKPGLNARYFLTADARAVPLHGGIEIPPFTQRLSAAWPPPVPTEFSATWEGAILVPADDVYTFATRSDDGSRLFVDGGLIVDNGGPHGPELKSGDVRLTRGVHGIFLEYDQRGGGYELDVLWARGGAELAPIPPAALGSSRANETHFRLSSIVWRTLAIAEWLSVIVCAAVLVSLATGWLRPVRRSLEQAGTWRVLRWIMAGSVLLNIVGLWWGLPGGWPPGELSPKAVLDAMARHFSGGWYDTYPPVQFYLLAAAITPALWLEWLGRIDLSGDAGYTLLALLMRSVSVLGGAATVVAVCLAGTRAFGARAGLFGAGVIALTGTFVYYAKTANVDGPYVAWFAISVVFYLRILDQLRMSDFVAFAAAAALAVCTKDQAYGLYLLMPAPILFRLWESSVAPRGVGRALGVLVDRRLLAAAAVSVALFAIAHNLVFNVSGFQEHVRYLVGPGSAEYQVYDATASGRWQLLVLTVRLIQQSLGWPFMTAAAAGVVLALARPASRRAALWLLVPVVSYYFSFINVILYNYDRFVLPLCCLAALFAGLGLEFMATLRAIPIGFRRTAVAAAFAYTLLYTATIDWLMIGDGRYVAEAWLASRVRDGDLVASTFSAEYLPRLDRFRHDEIRSIEGLVEKQPAFYVLNADYGRTVAADSPTAGLITGLRDGTLGYDRAFAFRRDSPWPWLPGGHHDLVGPRRETRVATVMRNINPTIEIYERRR